MSFVNLGCLRPLQEVGL
jgi:hypothetical protein